MSEADWKELGRRPSTSRPANPYTDVAVALSR